MELLCLQSTIMERAGHQRPRSTLAGQAAQVLGPSHAPGGVEPAASAMAAHPAQQSEVRPASGADSGQGHEDHAVRPQGRGVEQALGTQEAGAHEVEGEDRLSTEEASGTAGQGEGCGAEGLAPDHRDADRAHGSASERRGPVDSVVHPERESWKTTVDLAQNCGMTAVPENGVQVRDIEPAKGVEVQQRLYDGQGVAGASEP